MRHHQYGLAAAVDLAEHAQQLCGCLLYTSPLYEGHENDDSWRVEFQQNVELKPGLYFTSTIIKLDDLLARLHGTAPVELSAGNILVRCV